MYYDKEEENINNNEEEEELQNESSEELNNLTVNNKSSNKLPFGKVSNGKYTQNSKYIYSNNDDENETVELNNFNNSEQKSESKNYYKYERKFDSNTTPQTFCLNKSSEQKLNQNEDEKDDYNLGIIDENKITKTEFDSKGSISNNINNNNSYHSNKERTINRCLNFAYEEEQNIEKENLKINEIRNSKRNNNLYEDKDKEIKCDTINENFNDDINDYTIKNYNNLDNIKENKENNNNYNNNKGNNDYKKYVNEKLSFIPLENKENIVIEKNIIQKEKNSNNNEIKNNDNNAIRVNKLQSSNKNEEIDEHHHTNKKINESNCDLDNNENNEISSKKNYYYFCYDNSINIRNYPKSLGKNENSTEQNTINKTNLGNKSIEVKEFKEMDLNAFDSNNQMYEKKEEKVVKNKIIIKQKSNFTKKYFNVNNNGENNIYINNNKEKNKNEIIHLDVNTNNTNDYKNISKIKYMKDINNVKIYNNYEKNKSQKMIANNANNENDNVNEMTSGDIKKENELNDTSQNIDTDLNNYNYIINKGVVTSESNNTIINNNNAIIEKKDNLIIIPDNNYNISINNKFINVEEEEEDNIITRTNDSININTLESVAFKRMEEEDEKRTLEIEKEEKRLDELENEKRLLMLEEKERRLKILEEIERQEKDEKEKKLMMRKKYEENLRKKKSDEEKLKKIKMEQEKKIKEINELKYKKQLDEQKLLLLTKGKLNKQQRKKYRNLIKSETKISLHNPNKLPFDILLKGENGDEEKEKKDIIKRMKNDFIDKDYNFWNVKKNNLNNNENNIFKNKKLLYNNSGIEDYYHNNFNSNDNTINDRTFNLRNKNEKIKINTSSKLNEYMSFSPIPILKKSNFNLSIKSEKDKSNEINTESHQMTSFSSNNKIGKVLPDFLNKNTNFDNRDKRVMRIAVEEKTKNVFQQKNKEHHKNNDVDKNNEDNKNKSLNENSSNDKDNLLNSNDNNSFTELKEIKDITSRLSNEVEKKIEIINRTQNIFNAKSSPKIYPYNEMNKSEKDKDNNFKKPNKEKTNIINKEETTKMPKKKSFIEDCTFSNDSKKEYLGELNKLSKRKEAKKLKENIKSSFGNSITFRDNKYANNKILENINYNTNKNKSKKEKIIYLLKKDSKNYNVGNQKIYYKDFLYGSENNGNNNCLNENIMYENNSKFLQYYKELYE